MSHTQVSMMPSHSAAGKTLSANAGAEYARRSLDQWRHDSQHGFDGHADDYEHHHGGACGTPAPPSCGTPACGTPACGDGYGDGYGGCSDASDGCGCVRGYTQGCNYGDTCAFPQPPPRRCYCMPGLFSSTCGQTHHRLLDAYGQSRAC